MNSRINKLLSTLWTHKKKTIFISCAFTCGFNYAADAIRDSKIRQVYAEEARRYGDITVKPTDKNRRIAVLVNKQARKGKASNLFSKNALFLFNLAGIEVDIINANSIEEIKSISQSLDKSEVDAIYIVGGDGTLSAVLTGLFTKDDTTVPIPVGIFPGGQNNRSLEQLMSSTFEQTQNEVEIACQSAMALIKDTRKIIFPIKCEIMHDQTSTVSSDEQTVENNKIYYILSVASAGWFEHCNQKALKFWYLDGLKYRFAYFWEFIKNRPTAFKACLTYNEFCHGCNACICSKKTQKTTNIGWIGFFFRQKSEHPNDVDYSKIVNTQCPTKHELTLEATNIELINCQEKTRSKIVLNTVPPIASRISAISEGWEFARGRHESGGTSIEARKIEMKFLPEIADLPDFLRNIWISGTPNHLTSHETISLESVNRGIELFLPNFSQTVH